MGKGGTLIVILDLVLCFARVYSEARIGRLNGMPRLSSWNGG